MKKRIKTYMLEKFFPDKCPKCENKFMESGKDFVHYADPSYSPSSMEEIIKSHPELYKLKEDLLLEKRFDSSFVRCQKCRNITLTLNYSSTQTHSKEKAEKLIKDGLFNSISVGETMGTEQYIKATEGLLTLSFLAKSELREILNKFKERKIQAKEVENKEDRMRMIEEVDPILQKFVTKYLKKDKGVTKEKEDFLKRKFSNNWKKLDVTTKNFLITGEVILELLLQLYEEYKDLDFSPMIIEFSKGLEKELLLKLIAQIKNKKDNIKKEAIMNLFKGDRDLTLGEIAYLLKILKKESFLDFLPLKDPKYFLVEYNFTKKLERFIYKFRNKSAHITPISKEDCFECKKYLLEEPIKLLISLEEQIN